MLNEDLEPIEDTLPFKIYFSKLVNAAPIVELVYEQDPKCFNKKNAPEGRSGCKDEGHENDYRQKWRSTLDNNLAKKALTDMASFSELYVEGDLIGL